jgi:hypothetical protein
VLRVLSGAFTAPTQQSWPAAMAHVSTADLREERRALEENEGRDNTPIASRTPHSQLTSHTCMNTHRARWWSTQAGGRT